MDDQSKTHETGYYPKSMDELRFYLKHLVKKYKLSQPAEDDAVFNATNVQYAGRKKERHGYEAADKPGNDREVYEGEDHMNEGEVARMPEKFGTHKGKQVKILKIHKAGTNKVSTDYKTGENKVTGKWDKDHMTVQHVWGKASYPKVVPAHEVSTLKKEEVEGKRLTDILEVESLKDLRKDD